ncbi:MAG: hypothetical protein DRG27_05430 [Deltaproteobacteria bacterium]|nr:MAG: hypothetical protein DRG27_05430 [Deltaproteobacteria bacterium]
MRIKISIGNITLYAKLNNSPTAKKIWDILPLKASFNTWGDEIYFSVPVEAQLDETAKEEVKVGQLGYWPQGKAFCIFFGPTPISEEGKIIPASAVNIIGEIEGDPTCLKDAVNEKEIILEKAEG